MWPVNWDGQVSILEVELHQPIPLYQQPLHRPDGLHLEVMGNNPCVEGFQVDDWAPRPV